MTNYPKLALLPLLISGALEEAPFLSFWVPLSMEVNSYSNEFAPQEAISYVYEYIPFRKSFVLQESKQEDTKLMSLCKIGRKHKSA